MGGRSTKSFLDQKRLEPILNQIQPGDYLLIQFGHNDQKTEDPERYTDPFGTYQENLNYFVAAARERYAQPVLISSISRRSFKNGKIDVHSLGNYPNAMKEVAKDNNVPFINMHERSIQLLNELGEEKSKLLFLHLEENEYENYPNGLIDNTHFSDQGAKTFAQLIANELAILFDEMKTNNKGEYQ